MNKYWKMPKIQIIGVLSLFFIVAAPLIEISSAIYLLVTCVGFTILLDVTFTYLRSRKYFKPFAAVVTGLILTLTVDPSATWYQILIICAAAMAIKNFARFGNRHILNPAASGLLFGWIVFQMNPSWWGATLQSGEGAIVLNTLLYLLLIAIGYVSSYRLGRYVSVLSYIGLYTVLFPIVTLSLSIDALVSTIISPGMLFFAFLMVPEPMTSPVNKKRQAMYGSIVAVIGAILTYVSFNTEIANFPDSSILALLIGNILFFKKR